jgi:hypothetical protein
MLIFLGMNQTCAELAANGDGIFCLAFQLWEEAGCPEARYLEFWMGAETGILAPQRLEAVRADRAVAKTVIWENSAQEFTPIPHDNRCRPF